MRADIRFQLVDDPTDYICTESNLDRLEVQERPNLEAVAQILKNLRPGKPIEAVWSGEKFPTMDALCARLFRPIW